MAFVQIIEYATDRIDEVRAIGEDMRASGNTPPGVRGVVCEDLDTPGRYVMVVEFPSYEEAMANSNRPETQQMAEQMAKLMTDGPTFRNLNVIDTIG